jgi:hypothetical protein
MEYQEGIEYAAKAIAKIYEDKFGGKKRGRFLMPGPYMRMLAGLKTLETDDVRMIQKEAHRLGYIVMDIGDHFSVIEESIMVNYRGVPKSVMSKYVDLDTGEKVG